MLSAALRSEASRLALCALKAGSFAESTLSTQGEILRFAQDDRRRAQDDKRKAQDDRRKAQDDKRRAQDDKRRDHDERD